MTQEIEFAPDVHGTINAARSRGIPWRDVLGELIDNAFDAGATMVHITIDGKELSVEDNGRGCGDFAKMLTMGRHAPHETTKLGRYGVGFKDAAWWVGGPTTIRTIHKGRVRTLRVDWDHLTGWRLPDPGDEPSDGSIGTRITFGRTIRRFPDGKAFSDLRDQIGYIYSPALKDGRQIGIRRGRSAIELAQAYKLPPLVDVVDCTISVGDKTALLHVGIVPEGHANPKPGINYTHGFRVIIPETALGCGEYGSSRIAGWVRLDHGWRLTRNKDDISDHKEELVEAVYAAIKGIVSKASKQSMTLASASLATSLTQMFRGVASGIEGGSERRDQVSNHTGRIEPVHTGRIRIPKKTHPTRSAGTFRVDFRSVDDGAVGAVDLAGGTIWLADNHPAVIEAKRTQNTTALLFAAVFLFSAENCDTKTPLLPFMRNGEVASRVCLVAGRLLNQDHKQALRLVTKVSA